MLLNQCEKAITNILCARRRTLEEIMARTLFSAIQRSASKHFIHWMYQRNKTLAAKTNPEGETNDNDSDHGKTKHLEKFDSRLSDAYKELCEK